MGRRIGITESRISFVEQEQERKQQARRRSEQQARKMVMRMTGVDASDFDIHDFMFAATMGSPEDYEAEAQTAQQMGKLIPGQVVGITHQQRLRAIGVTSKNPLSLRVHSGFYGGDGMDLTREQYNRKLEASINLAHAIRRSREDHRIPQCDTEACSELSVDILCSWGEPDTQRSVFYKPHEVIIGSIPVLEQVVAWGDDLGLKQVGEFMTGLATQNLMENTEV